MLFIVYKIDNFYIRMNYKVLNEIIYKNIPKLEKLHYFIRCIVDFRGKNTVNFKMYSH